MGKAMWPRVLVSVVVVGMLTTAFKLESKHSEQFYAPAVVGSEEEVESVDLQVAEYTSPLDTNPYQRDIHERFSPDEDTLWRDDTLVHQHEPSLGEFFASIVDAIYHLLH